MAEKEKDVVEKKKDDTEGSGIEDRRKDYSGNKDVLTQLDKVYTAVVKAFDDKNDQRSLIERCWDVYNCVLNDQQGYLGTSKIYLPIVRDAIEARVTQFTNTIMPEYGNYAEVTSNSGEIPYEIISLLDHYGKKAKLRESVIPSLIRMGDVTGQYSLYVDWNVIERHTLKKVKRSEIQTETGQDVDGAAEYDDIEEELVEDKFIDPLVLDPREFVVLPATVDRIENAEVIAIALRMTEDKVREKRDAGEFEEEAADTLLENFTVNQNEQQPNPDKKQTSAAGIRGDSKAGKTALIYQVWTKIKVGGKRRWFVTHFAGKDNILACKRNPYWNDKVPVISEPAQKVKGSFWGKPRIETVEKAQYAANDAVNMGMDSAQYALLPIVMTDPEKNPRVGSMIMAMAAIWETNPNDTKFAQFPAIWKDAFSIVASCKDQIMQSLSTNPAMLAHGNVGKKPTQAQIAQEQQVALVTIADAVKIIEVGVCTPFLEWCYDMDYQFRDKPITIKQFGPLGIMANTEQVPPIQVGIQLTFNWIGSETTRSIQQIQQQIAAMNVIRSLPKEQLGGRELDIGPLVDHIAAVAFGPKLAPRVLKDLRHQNSMDPVQENELMEQSFPVEVHALDNDIQHIQTHMMAMQTTGDPAGFIRAHILRHMHQMQEKTKQQMPKGLPGAPGGAGPGAPGLPKPGAQPQPPTGAQSPAGAIHQDAIVDPGKVPQ